MSGAHEWPRTLSFNPVMPDHPQAVIARFYCVRQCGQYKEVHVKCPHLEGEYRTTATGVREVCVSCGQTPKSKARDLMACQHLRWKVISELNEKARTCDIQCTDCDYQQLGVHPELPGEVPGAGASRALITTATDIEPGVIIDLLEKPKPKYVHVKVPPGATMTYSSDTVLESKTWADLMSDPWEDMQTWKKQMAAYAYDSQYENEKIVWPQKYNYTVKFETDINSTAVFKKLFGLGGTSS